MKVILVSLLLVIAGLLFSLWKVTQSPIKIEYSTIENMYCANDFCYTIEKADHKAEYCFSKFLNKTCLIRKDFEVIE